MKGLIKYLWKRDAFLLLSAGFIMEEINTCVIFFLLPLLLFQFRLIISIQFFTHLFYHNMQVASWWNHFFEYNF